jgi:hypothetical protein
MIDERIMSLARKIMTLRNPGSRCVAAVSELLQSYDDYLDALEIAPPTGENAVTIAADGATIIWPDGWQRE